MSKTASKTSPALDRPASAANDLSSRCTQLQARERALTVELVEAESSAPGRGSMAAQELDAAATSLLAGEPVEVRFERTVEVIARDREVVRRALQIAQDVAAVERGERQRQTALQRLDEWRSLTRATAVAAIELRKLNRKREQFKREIGGTPELPCNPPPRGIFTVGVVGDQFYECIKQAVRAGILTQGEVDRYENS